MPADDPAPLVDVVRLYLAGQAGDPYERQRRLQQKRDAATVVIRRRLDPVRRGTFDALLRRAQAIAPIREDALADVGLAWPQLRRMLAELGHRLVAAGVIDRADDVYWCRRRESRTPSRPRETCDHSSRSAERSGVDNAGPRPRSCCPREPGWIGWAR